MSTTLISFESSAQLKVEVVNTESLQQKARRPKDSKGRHRHHPSYHSSLNSESNGGSPRPSVGECSSSTPTSIDDETAALQKRQIGSEDRDETVRVMENEMQTLQIVSAGDKSVDYFSPKQKIQDGGVKKVRDEEATDRVAEESTPNIAEQHEINEATGDETDKAVTGQDSGKEPSLRDEGVLGNDSLVHTDSYIQDLNDDHILLNNKVSRMPARRTRTQESIRKNIPFHASKHSQILPMEDEDAVDPLSRSMQNNSMGSLPIKMPKERVAYSGKIHPGSFSSMPPDMQPSALIKSEAATADTRKTRKSILHKREIRRKKLTHLDDDRVLIGNKVSEGHVNFIIAYNMLTGIRVAVSRCSGIMKPLTPKDFKCTKKLAFDYHGNELTPSSQYAFKFKDYSPEVFRELRAMFGLDPADYLVSLTSKYVLSELNSPGKSGSFFYFSRDYRYIIKTIHHAEHIHLRRHLHEYYTHIKANPDTLVSQFYGLHRVKMPISFRNKIKHRKIYFLVMNNLFPPHLEMHITFDLKGSTLGRYTEVDPERAKHDENYRVVLKDLNWLERREEIKFGPLKKKKLLDQLKKDVQFLAKLNIMDYSLLLGIHDLNKAKEEDPELPEGSLVPVTTSTGGFKTLPESTGGLPSGTVIPHFFKEFEGGIRSSDPFNNDTNLVYYVGIIDCLTNYSFLKKLETFWRGLSHDLKVVSAVPSKEYADRFYEFIADSVGTSPQTRYKDNPEVQDYRD
ncbi:hypothetical protein HG536_0C00370 [Torulaspora globosa]|uniref:1-phosphatidylinositol-4-phosphate 5-kinase n=1 Tax=Torulaspora globosa TaxID=48254 RepID=A0A7G3ZED4_9SACH|nr:uncharacterized protein HG536_0C00370 [Torulaspora globosa]QLL31870.1 hypothetical protein HG536_0C00370 [Torulaspora globosa]